MHGCPAIESLGRWGLPQLRPVAQKTRRRPPIAAEQHPSRNNHTRWPCRAAAGSLVSDGPPLPPPPYPRGPLGSLDSLDELDAAAGDPSPDLRDLAEEQLRSIDALLARFAAAAPVAARARPRTAVYARTAGSLDRGGDLQLVRVASWPRDGDEGRSGGGAGGFDGGCGAAAAAAGFAHRPLPRDGEELVILRGDLMWGDGGSSSSGAGAAAGSLDPAAAAAAAPCDVEASLVREEVLVLPNSASLVFPLSEGDTLVGLLVAEAGEPVDAASVSGAGAPPPFTEDELWVLRSSAGPLAKACAMDLRSALAGAAAAARQRLARSLLREVRGPLRALHTFSAMLAPRLPAGEPEGDMAAGLLTQHRRMNEVVAQLESALHTGGPRGGGGAAGAGAQLLAAPGGGAAPALGRGGAGARPLLAAPQGRGAPTLLASVSSVDSDGSSGSGGSNASAYGAAVVDAADGCCDCRAAAAAALTESLSSAQPGTSVASIGGGQRRTVLAPPRPGASLSGGGSMDSASATIDVELDGPQGARAAVRPGMGAGAAAPPGVNVVEVIGDLLPAAARLARQSGVDLVALPPLSLSAATAAAPAAQQRHRRRPGAARDDAAADAAGRAPALLPRPVRPLRAAAPPRAVRRALAHLLDLALQCTPRGGSITVGAREPPGGGAEVSLTLTGHLAPGRLHAASRELGPGRGGGGAGRLVSLEAAERLVLGSGGRLHVGAPRDAAGPGGAVESATRVEVWWPAAPAAA